MHCNSSRHIVCQTRIPVLVSFHAEASKGVFDDLA